MDKNILDEIMKNTLRKSNGIVEACAFLDQDRPKILEIEEEAEKRGLMGLGKVYNSGIREVLKCDLLYVALTNMDFDWGCGPSLVLKKDQDVVGEEVRDKDAIKRMSKQENVWFMHDNFVIYKDRVSFPQDLLKKTCYFDTPSLPAEWCSVEDERFECHSIVYANPSAPSDLFLKGKYFKTSDEKGIGTIFVGVQL